MKRSYPIYVRQHVNGWYTASLLDRSNYAAFGPDLSKLRDELAEAIRADTAEGLLSLPTSEQPMKHRTVTIELRAVQHQRLVMVPLRVSLFEAQIDSKRKLWDVRIPRLDAGFTIVGHDNVVPWAEEIVRGHFHLSSVQEVMAHQYERAERLDLVEVSAPPRSKRSAIRSENMTSGADDETHPLSALGIDLTHEADQRRIQRALYRNETVNTVANILSARYQPSVLLVGRSGVGKTALVNELAHRINEGSVLSGAKIWSIGGARIIAGAKFLGEWQERAKWVVQLMKAAGDIWFVGDLLELLSSGDMKSGHGVAQFLLPELQSGSLSLIAETTPDGLASAEQIDAGFVRALQRVPVRPLPLDRTEDLLERRSKTLGRQHSVTWAPGAVTAALDVVARFGDAEGLPGTGLSLLERMLRARSGPVAGSTISPQAATKAFSTMSGFPEALIDPDQRLDVDAVRNFFETRVIGQQDATDRLTSLIMLLKAGLDDPERPLGSFLFTGPTGVGKTEAALTLATYLFSDRKRVTRFDMSEFAYPGSGLRLVDGDRGEGVLTRPVRLQPFSVLLFDEVEKADPSVLDVLLQILGEGRLTDGTGRTVRFTHTIVIMTSNLGASRKAEVGFGRTDDRHRYREAVERFFRPEMLNRIDHVVPFVTLDYPSLTAIAQKILTEALAREGFSRRGVNVGYTPAVLERLSEEGFDPKYGARPMKRAVDTLVIVPLARLLAERTDGSISDVRLDVAADEVTVAVGS